MFLMTLIICSLFSVLILFVEISQEVSLNHMSLSQIHRHRKHRQAQLIQPIVEEEETEILDQNEDYRYHRTFEFESESRKIEETTAKPRRACKMTSITKPAETKKGRFFEGISSGSSSAEYDEYDEEDIEVDHGEGRPDIEVDHGEGRPGQEHKNGVDMMPEGEELEEPIGYEEEIERASKVNETEFSNSEKIDPEWYNDRDSKSGVPFWYQKWPYLMPIQIDKKFGPVTVRRIKAALWHLYIAMDKCFKFTIIDPNCKVKGTKTKWYVRINRAAPKDSIFCASAVGKQKNGQSIIMQWYCDVFPIIHEVMHTLGFYHEHTRSDRDQYVTVDYARMKKNNVSADTQFQYAIDKNQKDYVGFYDFDSIMHYGFTEYFKPKKNKVPKGIHVGHVNHLSEGDIQRLKLAYPCNKAPKR